MSANRPAFRPEPLFDSATDSSALQSADSTQTWVPVIGCSADFPIEIFEPAVSQLLYHPEYNSTLILRTEIVSESENQIPATVPSFQGYQPIRCIHRKLLPRRPGRDEGLEQYCTLYGQSVSDTDADPVPSLLVLTPIVDGAGSPPYYHPRVSHLAFRYVPAEAPSIRIEAVPLPDTPLDLNSRLYRTCLALLETLHRYGWGTVTQYKKRVIHDRVVPRDAYQDLYLVLRERHKHLVNEWHEVTDPLKHVFEDIGIATFLILLWKRMYKLGPDEEGNTPLDEEPWRSWPRPPAGFVDLGCGNGLLTHILVSEGYEGCGVDVRARTSWSHYPEATQKSLRVEALDPTAFIQPDYHHPSLLPGVFLIGNHADELTPWVPVIATLCRASGYLSIPCCAWTFDSRYERSRNVPYPTGMSLDEFIETLHLGGDGSNASSYSHYRIWLASLSLHCGWKVESETLRIPSTRNWALIGREHSWNSSAEEEGARQNVLNILAEVDRRGMFKTRRPEGKAGDH
ncbi:tRNA (uracil-O(2)-)-methyltransferase [Phanerochaete sordida]|uniref:tRNA (uracil-O(2)-)-methyltransferase n=1 Tax=Phanerochaete sordida TaxID=48140 RepID=A0A9P3L865_9APHY|nr:tRNA (uracil-O(2)-)-methyltransferase [Phanerochaete sordida]